MREIVLDTETTGLKPEDGHRIIEIGALEMVNHVPTGKTLHLYINPERPIEEEAIAVHGITNEQVENEPVFADIADQFLEFIGQSKLVIHNARFDMGFINAELARLDKPELPMDRAIDTLDIARRRFPGGQASLDALCRKFNIDNSHRELHGAMIDTDLLADVYIELIGGKQPGLSLAGPAETASSAEQHADPAEQKPRREPRPHAPSDAELAAHQAFITELKEPVWKNYS